MRILIDLQCSQESWYRGIGRWGINAVRELVQFPEIDCFVLINTETKGFSWLKDELKTCIPPERWVYFSPIIPCAQIDPKNRARRIASQEILRSIVANVAPDWVLYSSVFPEPINEIVLVPADSRWRLAAVSHDMIPYVCAEEYLSNQDAARSYLEGMKLLESCDVIFGISQSSSKEVADNIPLRRNLVVTIGAAAHQPSSNALRPESKPEKFHCLNSPFVLYVSTLDSRKNHASLIRAFTQMDAAIQASHQLVFAGHVEPDIRIQITELAQKSGLPANMLHIFGQISESELTWLYQTCKLFVFPSKHEGFGLPVLEAMFHDAPVIGSLSSSLPEIIDWEEAMFDPLNVTSIAATMQHALEDDTFLAKLVANGRTQRARFSWKKVATRITETLREFKSHSGFKCIAEKAKPKLAFVTSSAAFGSLAADLIPALSLYFQLHLVLKEGEIPWLGLYAHSSIEEHTTFYASAARFDHIVYEWDGSVTDVWMTSVMRVHPGTVILRSFIGLEKIDAKKYIDLWRDSGWAAVLEASQIARTKPNVPLLEWLLRMSQNVICSDETFQPFLEVARRIGKEDSVQYLPHPHRPVPLNDRDTLKRVLHFSPDLLLCAVIGSASDQLEWLQNVPLPNVQFVDGESSASTAEWPIPWIPTTFAMLLASNLAVIIYDAENKTQSCDWVYRCIAANIGTLCFGFPDELTLHPNVLFRVSNFVNKDVLDEVAKWSHHQKRLEEIRLHHRDRSISDDVYKHAVKKYADVFAKTFGEEKSGANDTIQTISQRLSGDPSSANLSRQIAQALNRNFPPTARPRLVFDATVVSESDAGTGIQRVVKNLLLHYLRKPWPGFATEVSALTHQGVSECPVGFVLQQIGIPFQEKNHRAPLILTHNDFYLNADAIIGINVEMAWKKSLQHAGFTCFIVHDILVLQHPEWFPADAIPLFNRWFKNVVALADAIVCVSRTVAEETHTYLRENAYSRSRPQPLKIGFFHNGATFDLEKENQRETPDRVPGKFLMVSTIEPRKGHRQTLEAFEQLWQQNVDVTLHIVGRKGWCIDDLIRRISTHPELHGRLRWHDGVSDDVLVLLS